MPENAKNMVVKVNAKDNVGIVSSSTGLEKGYMLEDGIALTRYIPMGHKVALTNLKIGDEIKRYGEVIGYAKTKINQGDWIEERNIEMPEPPDLDNLPLSKSVTINQEPLEGYSFQRITQDYI